MSREWFSRSFHPFFSFRFCRSVSSKRIEIKGGKNEATEGEKILFVVKMPQTRENSGRNVNENRNTVVKKKIRTKTEGEIEKKMLTLTPKRTKDMSGRHVDRQ